MTDDFRPKSIAMQEMEHRTGRELTELLLEMYQARGLTQRQIADELGLDTSTVTRWMRALGIRARREGRPPAAVA